MANTTDTDRVNLSFPILKMETTGDGDLIVYGKATDGSIDSDDQIVDQEWSAKALEDWLKSGANIRVQHSPYLYPAGKGMEVETTPDGHYIKALVVEETAKKLVSKGVLQAFSVGIGSPKIVRDVAAKGGRIVGGTLVEISLVDRPANANCGFSLCKSQGDTLVSTEVLFGELQAALEAAETKVDAAVPSFSDDELLSEYAAERETFLASMPPMNGGTKTPEWSEWNDTKNKMFDGTDEARAAWVAKRNGEESVTEVLPSTEAVDALVQAAVDGAELVVKAGQKDCSKCGKGYDADAKTRKCEKCGASLPQADDDGKSVDAEIEKADEVAVADDAEIFPVEVEKSELPYSMTRLHDISCGVYSDEVLRSEYASLKSWADAVNVDVVREHFGDEAAEIAAAIKSADPDLLADARAGLHKGFAAANPGAGVRPGSITPGMFRRPYLTAGHIPNGPTVGSGPRIPDANRVVEPGQFGRGAITDGHQRPSPAATGDNAVKGVNGSEQAATAAFVQTATAAYTRNALQNIHDHISERKPEICAFSQKQTDMPADMNATAVLTPVVGADSATDDGPGWKGADADVFKSAVDSAVVEKTAYYDEEIASLKAEIEKLSAQPDPAQAPVRGVVAKSYVPADRETEIAVKREPTEDELIAQYAAKFSGSGNPEERKYAEAFEALTLDN